MSQHVGLYIGIHSFDDASQSSTSPVIFKASIALIAGSCLVLLGVMAVSFFSSTLFHTSAVESSAIFTSLQKPSPVLPRTIRGSTLTRARPRSFSGEFLKSEEEIARTWNSFGDNYGAAQKWAKPKSFSGEFLKGEGEITGRGRSFSDEYGATEKYAQERRELPEQRAFVERREPQEPWSSPEIIIQGGALKTWTYMPAVERVQVVLKTDGRPMDADVDLWAGPDNIPVTMHVYVESGEFCPFSTVLETPGGPSTIAVRNAGQMEFPITAQIDVVPSDEPLARLDKKPTTIQGGALKTYPFAPNVGSVEVLLKTYGRPLNARIELLHGPTSSKQVIEIYSDDGMERPFYAVLQTPGSGNVVRIVNTATLEFPLLVSVSEFTASSKYSYDSMKPLIQ